MLLSPHVPAPSTAEEFAVIVVEGLSSNAGNWAPALVVEELAVDDDDNGMDVSSKR